MLGEGVDGIDGAAQIVTMEDDTAICLINVNIMRFGGCLSSIIRNPNADVAAFMLSADYFRTETHHPLHIGLQRGNGPLDRLCIAGLIDNDHLVFLQLYAAESLQWQQRHS